MKTLMDMFKKNSNEHERSKLADANLVGAFRGAVVRAGRCITGACEIFVKIRNSYL